MMTRKYHVAWSWLPWCSRLTIIYWTGNDINRIYHKLTQSVTLSNFIQHVCRDLRSLMENSCFLSNLMSKLKSASFMIFLLGNNAES